ncbi:hypothetical protein SCHPADRAFT_894900 [Schizopora paradoxa]|uniref:Uncharacterized protein n=1 Tax=Schizopora paradoxa TaxID=27342 RepID=A0A0H2R5S7_9AGAM|nr:hypothetical protein SCHPADRAFT_894900 [Schizopora paradoxa]
MNREPSVDEIVTIITGVDAQRNIDELIRAREDDPNLLSRFDQTPQSLSSHLKEYVDDEGTVYLLDDEQHEMNFVSYGFLCEIMLPLNLSEMAKSKERFRPGNVRQAISIIGGGSESFAKFIAAQRAIYSFLASTTGREPFRSFVPDYFAGIECLSSSTKLFSKQKASKGSASLELPVSLDYTGRVLDVCRRKGFSFTEDNLVNYWRLVPSSTESGFDVVDIPVSFFSVGQLVEVKLSFRAYKLGHSYVFRTKLNSVTVYNDDVTREIDDMIYRQERGRQESNQMKIGAPKTRKMSEYRLSHLRSIRFLQKLTRSERAGSSEVGPSDYEEIGDVGPVLTVP